MPDKNTAHSPFSNSLLRLDTLVRLRWLAVAGQTAAILIVYFPIGFELPIGACFALIALSAWLNLFLKMWYPSSLRLPDKWAATQLGYDLIQLSGLLYLTGGLGNPFAFLMLAPVMVSATALAPKWTVILVLVASLAASILALYQMPLPWIQGEAFELPNLYELGVWIALVFSLIFMASYAFRVAKEGRQLADALAATELVLAREQHLNALDGLAAAAAHELGTPLATIYLAAKELESEFEPDDIRGEDVTLIRGQSDRCREILQKLTQLSSEPDEMFRDVPVSQLLEEVIAPHRDFGVAISTSLTGDGNEPVGLRNPAIHYGLGNLIENAVDFAGKTVDVSATWTSSTLKIVIADDGPGFSPDVMDRLGDPYVTTRTRSKKNDSDATAGGLGLGFFIAKTLLERNGGKVELANRRVPDSGAVITITWPRAAMDQAKSR
ncbi:MAG: ActS/PrrB/RegB family redox-sensitive histidine kinase [Stappiaceae bacterium]